MKKSFSLSQSFGIALVIGLCLATVPGASAQSTNTNANTGSRRSGTNDPIARIRDEGLNRSEVMKTLSYLSDVIGPRLTGSPNMKRANEWTREKMASWGLANAQIEPWGHFGQGLVVEKVFSAGD